MKTLQIFAARAATVCAALTLVACGGGGSASSTPGTPSPSTPAASPLVTLDASNYQRAAQSAVSRTLFLQDAGSAFGTGGSARAQLALQGGLLTRHALALAVPRHPTATGQISVPCAQGGSLVVVLSDGNNNGQLDVGDSLSLEAQACKEPGATLNGKLAITLQTLSGVFGSASYSATVTMTMTAFSSADANGVVTGDGSVSLSLSQASNGSAEVVMDVPKLALTSRTGGVDLTESLTTAHLRLQEAATGTLTLSVEATLQSTAFNNKQIQITTPTLWSLQATDRYPSAGQLLIKGDAGSQVRVTALNNAQVQIELDANGDGVFETRVVKSWSSLGS